MSDREPPTHKFHLQAIDWGIVSFIGHYPFNANAVANVGKGDSVEDVTILEDANFEGGCFAEIGMKVAFWASADSTAE
jgi:hypothetical protein